MKPSAAPLPSSAARNRARSASSGARFLTATGPVQQGRASLIAPARRDISLRKNPGKSSRSAPRIPGLSPEKPLRRSLMYVA
jgi:hypothetical protein